MTNRIYLSIPKPCHENWDNMAPAERGRFCMACQKQVIDFTKASDREIAEALKQDKNLCGRFINTQLDRDLVVPKTKKGYSVLAGFTFLSLLLPAAQKVLAQGKPMVTIEKDTDSITKDQKNMVVDHVTGTVLDPDKTPLPQALVENLSSNQSTTTDMDGTFTLTVSAQDLIKISYVGYESITFKYDGETVRPNIVLQEEKHTDNIIIDVYGKPAVKRSFFGRIFHKIGNIFRKND